MVKMNCMSNITMQIYNILNIKSIETKIEEAEKWQPKRNNSICTSCYDVGSFGTFKRKKCSFELKKIYIYLQENIKQLWASET